MNFLQKGIVVLAVANVVAVGHTMGVDDSVTLKGTFTTSVALKDCRIVLPMDACYVFDHGSVNPRITTPGTFEFFSTIETGVLTADDIWRNSYTFLATYTREDGSEGVVTSVNAAAADLIVGSKSWSDLFNPEGYGFTEDQIVQAIHDTYSFDEMVALDGRNRLMDWEYGMMNTYVNDVSVISELGKESRLIAFSTASDVGSIQASPSAAPGPAAGLSMIAGFVGMALRKRRKAMPVTSNF
jgi:hypothetical protein